MQPRLPQHHQHGLVIAPGTLRGTHSNEEQGGCSNVYMCTCVCVCSEICHTVEEGNGVWNAVMTGANTLPY
jgi:hypothetical protein